MLIFLWSWISTACSQFMWKRLFLTPQHFSSSPSGTKLPIFNWTRGHSEWRGHSADSEAWCAVTVVESMRSSCAPEMKRACPSPFFFVLPLPGYGGGQSSLLDHGGDLESRGHTWKNRRTHEDSTTTSPGPSLPRLLWERERLAHLSHYILSFQSPSSDLISIIYRD